MAIGDRLRRAAATVASRLQQYSAGAPVFPGIGLPAPRYPLVNPRTEKRLQDEKPAAMESRISANAGPYSDRISIYPETSLDPTKIDRILKAADLGVAIYEYGDLAFGVRRRDSHLMGIDRKRRQGVANKEFLVWPNNENDPLSVGLSHAMRSMVDAIDGFPSSVYSLLSQNCDGWSTSEVVWKPGKLRFQIPDGYGGGPIKTIEGLWPRQLYWVHPKHSVFAQDSADEPMMDLGPDGVIRLAATPGKFIYSMTPGEGIASARGYLRAVVWMHFFKHASIRDWNVFLHLYGIPYLNGRLDRKHWDDTNMKNVLLAAMETYGTGDEFPVLTDGMDIEVRDPVSLGGAGDAHFRLAGFCNAEQSKAVNGSTLTTEPGQNGAYNLGYIHQDAEHDVVVGDAISAAAAVRRDLFLAAIEQNADAFAEAFNVRPEELVLGLSHCGFRTDREWTPAGRQKMFHDAAANGVKVSIAQYRRETNLQKPISPADTMKGEPVPLAKGGAAVGSVDAADGADNPAPEETQAPPPESPPPGELGGDDPETSDDQ